MGQAPSAPSNAIRLETRVEEPSSTPPKGLALVAHGRLGGTFDQPPVRLLAEYLRDSRNLRVVTWNARGIGQSGGGSEWSALEVWTGGPGVEDYKRMLEEAIRQYIEDFPAAHEAELFICGYSAGAIFASCTRPAPLSSLHFAPPRYILISYPVELNPLIGLHKSGSYFRALVALVQGDGWENLPEEFEGKEPEVNGVFTITGGREKFLFYGMWTGNLRESDKRKVLRQVVVDGAGHDWGGKAERIVMEVDKWLQGED